MYYVHVSCGRYMKAFVSTYVRDDNAPVKLVSYLRLLKVTRQHDRERCFCPVHKRFKASQLTGENDDGDDKRGHI